MNTGTTHGYGTGVDMGDGTIALADTYDTVKLPEEYGGSWCAVLGMRHIRMTDGRIGRYLTLAHDSVDVIELLDGSGYLWVRRKGGEEE